MRMMKNPLHYQISEYDCGPTTMLNAISYLFDREQIPPEIVRNIMLYSLDTYSLKGEAGKFGTSRMAMMFLSSWLDGTGKAGLLPISCTYLQDREVYVERDSRLVDAVKRGGVAIVRLYLDEVEHYILLTGEENCRMKAFDPYYQETLGDPLIQMDWEHPSSYNRIIPYGRLNEESNQDFAMGRVENREAVLIFNTDTMLTPERTIEYFI